MVFSFALTLLSAWASTARAQPRLDVVLTPHVAAGEVDYVDVQVTVEAPAVRAGGALLRLPMVFAGVESARYRAEDLQVSDGQGPLALSQRDDPVDRSNFLYFRRWAAARATVGDLTVRYRAPARVFTPLLGSGPPFDLRPEAGGIAGSGVSFLALPDRATPYRIRLRWVLSGMAPGARGVCSHGEGDVQVTGPVELLVNGFYFAGPLTSYPARPNATFQVYWLSPPPFDADAVGRWTERAHAAIATFFGEPQRPYRVFLRHNTGGALGGAALLGSFMVGYGDAPAPTAESLRGMLAHEMVHTWTTVLESAAGDWYAEGMAEVYSSMLSLRAGLITPAAFLAEVNARALSYYASAVNSLPGAQIAERFWTDTRVRRLPYDRGAFYLATVDAQVRARSGGARKLDDLTFAMLDRRRRGQRYDAAAWVSLITKELGDGARTAYEAMMAGALQVPPDGAFGPCFRREATIYRTFDLGFDPAVLATVPRVVRGVVTGSNAERAGLRAGDEITHPVVLDRLQSDESAELTLELRRAGELVRIRYLPRGAEVAGHRWVRVDGVPDSACAI